MRRGFSVSLSIFALASLAMSGCGGSGSGGNGGGSTTTTVTFTFDSAGAIPAVVATRIGSGAFTPATLSSNVLTLSTPEGTTDFALAYLCPAYPLPPTGITFNRQYVIEASIADGTSFEEFCENPSTAQPQVGTLSGTVDASAIPDANVVWLFDGTTGQGQGIGGTVADLSFQAPLGNADIVAMASQNTLSNGTLSQTILAVKDLGEQTVPIVLNGGNPIMLGEADLTTQQPITYQNLPSGYEPDASVTFLTDGGGVIPLLPVLNTASSSYPAVPAAMLHGNARYEFSALAGDIPTNLVEFDMLSNSEGPVTIAFPSVWNYSGPSAAALPVFDFSSYAGFTRTSGVAYEGRAGWQDPTNTLNSYQVAASATYLDGSETLSTPDLSGLSGFLTAPPSGSTVSWNASISKNSAGAFGSMPLNSSTQTVSSGGNFVVP